MEKYLLFTTGGGTSDPLNWSRDEGVLYPVSKFNGIRPSGPRSLTLYFEGGSTVELGIKNGLHGKIMASIGTAISKSTSSVIAIADVDGGRFVNKNIYSVTIS